MLQWGGAGAIRGRQTPLFSMLGGSGGVEGSKVAVGEDLYLNLCDFFFIFCLWELTEKIELKEINNFLLLSPSLSFFIHSYAVSQIWSQDVASAYHSTEPSRWIEHMMLVMKLNSFPVINQTVLFAHKHTERMRYYSRSNSVKFREHSSKVLTFSQEEQQKPLEQHGWINLQGPKLRPEPSKFCTSEEDNT